MVALDLAEPQLPAGGRRQSCAGLAADPPATSLIRNEFTVRLVSLIGLVVAALSILGLLEPDDRRARLASPSCFGGHRFSLLLAIKVGALLAFALWLANVASNFVDAASPI